MTPLPSRDDLQRIRKLAGLAEEIRRTQLAVSITRLTVLKSLCQEHERANRFVADLARKTFENLSQAKEPSTRPAAPTDQSHREMMEQALEGLAAWQRTPTEKLRRALSELHGRMVAEQNEHRNIPFGALRLITDGNLLLFEYALSCLLAHEREVGMWAYQTARQYAERYDPSHGTGLTPASIPLVQDIVEFWVTEYALTPESLTPPPKAAKARADDSLPAEAGTKRSGRTKVTFTPRQGQFLAFIHLYRKLHRRGPAEADLVTFFRVTPPAAHGMVVKLEELGLVTRDEGVARSVRVAIPAEALPELEDVAGPPW